MQVAKRNGNLVDFDGLKIVQAIEACMRETKLGVDSDIAWQISEKIGQQFKHEMFVNVEEIQDRVEDLLMTEGHLEYARTYIRYRNTKAALRGQKLKTPGILSEAFLSRYKHLPNPMGQLGSFVYYRTYSRYLPHEKRREYWWETVRRAVEYNCSLAPCTVSEAEQLFDNIFHLRQFLSGRTFWVGNTQAAFSYPMSNYNCLKRETEFLTKDGIRTFCDFEDGDTAVVLNGNGAWSEAKVRNFGPQELVKLTVRRGRTVYTEDIYTTAEHLWFVTQSDRTHYKTVETKNLRHGDILRRKTRYEHTQLNTCSIGIQHGIVFGDGTFDKKTGHCKISLIGDKKDLLKYFTTGSSCSEGDRDSVLVYGLPHFFKELPSDANPEYIKGFLTGLLLTDGSFKPGARLFQTDSANLLAIQGMFESIGITTSKAKCYPRKNKNFGDYADPHGFSIHKESMQKQGMLVDLLGNVEAQDWVVESVESTGIVEDVWCVVEPITNSFTLRGGIHTHNCASEVIDNFEAFAELFYLLMLGSGVGLRILKSDVAKLPKVRGNVTVIHEDYVPKTKAERLDNTTLNFMNDTTARVTVGDSKEGWMQALRFYFEILSRSDLKRIDTVLINYDHVRPKGEKLIKFGGTASGHESLKTMFYKINKVVAARTAGKPGKLKTIDCLDICNIIGENVVSGGVRRSSEIMLIDADDDECIGAKANLYVQVNGTWVLNKEIGHRQMSNNSIYYLEKPSRERLHWQMEKMRYSGEPAWINAKHGMQRRENMNGVNPCFRGDMRLLTARGYVPFASLEGQEVDLINKDGEISQGKVWCSGEKPIIEVRFGRHKSSIYCTADHRFMLNDGSECEAKDLKRKRLMPILVENSDISEFVKYGVLQGDGCLGRLNSVDHLGLELNAGHRDDDIKSLFGIFDKDALYDASGPKRKFYINGFNEILRDLGFSPKILPERTFPTTFDKWTQEQKAHFLKGCYGANGSVINGRITYKTTCRAFAEKLKDVLANFGIAAYITTNRDKDVEFSNGLYHCLESYDVNIQRYDDRVFFYNQIGFVQKYKMEKLKYFLMKHAPLVVNVVATGTTEKVYDFNEPLTHWGVVEGVVVHNCGEILLDNKGMCNLTTINVMSFVTESCILNISALLAAQRLSVRAGYRMTCVEMELHKWDTVLQRDKLVGASLTGWQDMINATGMNREEETDLLALLRLTAQTEARRYAQELGMNEPLLVTTVKPEGTLSQLPTVSSGVHYSHSPFFVRRVRISATDPLVKVCEELGWPVFPEVGQDPETCVTKIVEFPVKAPQGRTKADVSAIEQLENYKMFMEHYVDHNCSITVHVRDEEWEAVEQWVWDNWDHQIGISFLPFSDSFYQMMPYESISEEEYNTRLAKMQPFIPSLISKYEVGQEEFDSADADCASGLCPVK